MLALSCRSLRTRRQPAGLSVPRPSSCNRLPTADRSDGSRSSVGRLNGRGLIISERTSGGGGNNSRPLSRRRIFVRAQFSPEAAVVVVVVVVFWSVWFCCAIFQTFHFVAFSIQSNPVPFSSVQFSSVQPSWDRLYSCTAHDEQWLVSCGPFIGSLRRANNNAIVVAVGAPSDNCSIGGADQLRRSIILRRALYSVGAAAAWKCWRWRVVREHRRTDQT